MPNINTLDFLKGAKATVEVGDWVASEGAGTLIDLGALDGIEVDGERQLNFIEADNSTVELDAYYVKTSHGLKFTVKQANLRHLAEVMGDQRSAVAVVPRSAGVTDGTATYGIDEPSQVNYKQVRITVDGQSMKPGHTEAPSDVYSKRVLTYWRCIFIPKLSAKFAKNGEWMVPCELKCLKDSTAVAGRQIGKIVDTYPK